MRLLALLAIVAMSLPLLAFGPQGIGPSDARQVPLYSWQIQSIRSESLPSLTASAAVAIDADTGEVLFDKRAHDRRAPASMTKIVTALVAVQLADLQEVVTIHSSGWDLGDGSVMGLVDGERIRMKDLLIGLLLPSGNDAALAIAEVLGPGQQRFVERMNQVVAELGLTDTHFTNPHGLNDPGHYSSAYDLAQLGRKAMSVEAIRSTVSRESAHVQAALASYDLTNTNPILGIVQGADGIKTGYTEEAGYCLLGSVSREGRRVIFTLMDSQDRKKDTEALMEYAFGEYAAITPRQFDSPLWQCTDAAGNQLALRATGTGSRVVLAWANTSARVRIGFDEPVVTCTSGGLEGIGWIEYRLGDQSLLESRLAWQ